MDLESRVRWEAYTKAKGETMLERTHIPKPLVGGCRRWTRKGPPQLHSPPAEPAALPGSAPCPVVLPERVRNPEYFRQPVPASMYVPEVYWAPQAPKLSPSGRCCYRVDSCWRLFSKRWRPKTLQTDGAVCICCGPIMGRPRTSGSCLPLKRIRNGAVPHTVEGFLRWCPPP